MTEQDRVVVLEDNHRLRTENDTLRRERDEARREVCEMTPRTYIKQAYEYAHQRGWDCFKEEPRWKSDPNIISLDELARCTRNQTP